MSIKYHAQYKNPHANRQPVTYDKFYHFFLPILEQIYSIFSSMRIIKPELFTVLCFWHLPCMRYPKPIYKTSFRRQTAKKRADSPYYRKNRSSEWMSRFINSLLFQLWTQITDIFQCLIEFLLVRTAAAQFEIFVSG